MLLLLLSACQTPTVQPTVADTCTQPWRSWENSGHPVALTWCTGCHAEGVVGEARRGAPDSVNLDTRAGFLSWEARVRARVLAGDMPPGGGLPPEVQSTLMEWLNCGGPGEEETGALDAPWEGELDPLAMAARLEDDPDFPDGVTLRHYAEIGRREGLVMAERYQLLGSSAEFLGYSLFDAQGLIVEELLLSPGLPLLAPEETVQISTQVSLFDSAGERSETWEWELTQGDGLERDPHERGDNPWEILAISSSGELHGWHLDEQLGVVARWAEQPDGDTWSALQTEATTVSYGGPEAFPLDPEWAWMDMSLSTGFFP